MKLFAKVILIPVITVLKLIDVVLGLIIRIECLVFGISFLVLGIGILLAIINKIWLLAGILGGILVTEVVISFLTTSIKIIINRWVE